MILVNGIILDESTGLPIQGASIKETISIVINNTGKILGRDYEIIKTTTPYTLKIKSKSGSFESLKLSALNQNVNVESIKPEVEKNKEGQTILGGYTFTFKNGKTRIIDPPTIKDIILFIDDSSQTTYTNSGLTIEKLKNG